MFVYLNFWNCWKMSKFMKCLLQLRTKRLKWFIAKNLLIVAKKSERLHRIPWAHVKCNRFNVNWKICQQKRRLIVSILAVNVVSWAECTRYVMPKSTEKIEQHSRKRNYNLITGPVLFFIGWRSVLLTPLERSICNSLCSVRCGRVHRGRVKKRERDRERLAHRVFQWQSRPMSFPFD